MTTGDMGEEANASQGLPEEEPAAEPGDGPQTDSAGDAPMRDEPPASDGAAGRKSPAADEPDDEADGEHDLALDECDLDTGFAGDEYCILPPPKEEGFQLHIGPSDYENPDPAYVLEPMQESTDSFTAVSGNDEEVYFYYRQYRMRPGAHHMIVSQGSGGFGGRRIATSNNVAQDSPPGGLIAPENRGVGVLLPPNAPISVSLHSINVTDEPILRELWVNFWYQNKAEVTQPASQLFKAGDVGFTVQPGEHTVLGPYSCEIAGSGRMLWFYGHRHANNLRFSAWRVRGEQRDLLYEGYDWEEVMVLEYSSLVENPMADRELAIEGGWSGPLDLEPGDLLTWECEVRNTQDTPLRFTNNTYTGEMCIMDAELVGVTCEGGGGTSSSGI